jgi:hypothetical protein
MSIVFRSRVLDHTYSGNSFKSIRQRGTDWSNLRIYENDDTRDIAWSRSNNENIYIKERHNQWAIHIIGAFIRWSGEEFFIENIYESKWFFLDSAMQSIQKSAFKSNYTYTQYAWENIDSIWKKLKMAHTRNTLLLIFRIFTWDSSVSKEILNLSSQNDIVMIDIFHQFELNPTSDIMIDGKILSQSSITQYKRELAKREKEDDSILNRAHISRIKIKTNENLENRLNYFFKERYHG